jgi:hypothetical protein
MGGCLSSKKYKVDPGSVDAELEVNDKEPSKGKSSLKLVSN